MTNDNNVSLEEGQRVLLGYFAGMVMVAAGVLCTSMLFTNFWVPFNPALKGVPEILFLATIAVAGLGVVTLQDACKKDSWMLKRLYQVMNIFEAEDAVAYSKDSKKQ
jgi:hypothetical protein